MELLHLLQANAGLSMRKARWKKLGIGVILAFTLKGIVTASMLAVTLLGLFQ